MTADPPSPNDPLPRWSGNDRLPRRRRSIWSGLGVILAVALGVFGLLVVTGFIILVIGLNNTGSSK